MATAFRILKPFSAALKNFAPPNRRNSNNFSAFSCNFFPNLVLKQATFSGKIQGLYIDLKKPATSFCAAAGPMEKQFEEFRQQLEDSANIREKLRTIVADIESEARVMQAEVFKCHYTTSPQENLNKVKAHIEKLKEHYAQLAKVIKDAPGQYYRYHDHWRYQTQNVVYLIVFHDWLETGNLLSYAKIQSALELNPDEFGLDIDDYLIGVCNMSNELPRYVVNQVTIGEYECPGRVHQFLSDLYAAFRLLNLRNDLLRKKFDGIKYDLKRVEELNYDVKIRGLVKPS